jgi:hypothetical protein
MQRVTLGMETPEDEGPFRPSFFRPWEWATLRQLILYIAPPSPKAPSAIDAGVPEWIDGQMTDQPAAQSTMRGGLAWVESESRVRFGTGFIGSTDEQRQVVLREMMDVPAQSHEDRSPGAVLFSHLRDYTATAAHAPTTAARAHLDVRYEECS